MSEEELIAQAKDSPANYQFAIMIFSSIAIAAISVAASLMLYYSTGAHQLDLSRPGYEEIREQALNETSYKGFNPSGDIDEQALNEFEKQYKRQLKELETIDAFSGDVLSPKSLQLEK